MAQACREGNQREGSHSGIGVAAQPGRGLCVHIRGQPTQRGDRDVCLLRRMDSCEPGVDCVSTYGGQPTLPAWMRRVSRCTLRIS